MQGARAKFTKRKMILKILHLFYIFSFISIELCLALNNGKTDFAASYICLLSYFWFNCSETIVGSVARYNHTVMVLRYK